MPAFEYLVRRRLLASLVAVGGSGITFGGTGLGIRASGSGSGSRGSGSSSGLSFSGSLGSVELSHFLGLLEHGHNSVVVVEHGTGTGGHLNLVDGEALVHIDVGDVDGNLVGHIQRLGCDGNGFHVGFEEAAELDALGRAGEFDGHVNRDFLIEINTVVIDMGDALLVRMLLHVPEEAGICGLLAVVVNLKVENGGVADFKVELFERQGRNLHIDVFALAVVEDAGNKGLRTQTVSDAFAGAFSLLGTEGFFDSHNIYSLSAAGREDELYRRFACPRYAELDKKNADGRAGAYRQFICGEGGVIDYWLDRGASGFRLDVADELPDGFIAACRTAVKRHPGCLLIGEVWEDASNKVAYSVRRRYLLGHELDGVMNYPFRTAILGFLRTGDAAAFAEAVTGILENYPAPVWPLLMNMLSTHDTERIITALAAGRPPHSKQAQREYILPREEFLRGLELVKLAAALQFTLPGFPSVYYGDEIAMQGFGDPFCRAYYRWDDPPADLRGLMRSLSALRRSQPAFHTGGCRFLLAENGAVAYLREEKDSRVLVLVNRGEQTAELTIDGRCFRCQPWRTCIEVL